MFSGVDSMRITFLVLTSNRVSVKNRKSSSEDVIKSSIKSDLQHRDQILNGVSFRFVGAGPEILGLLGI